MPPETPGSILDVPSTAFEGHRQISAGSLERTVLDAKRAFDAGGSVLVFDDVTGDAIDIDYGGSAADVVARLTARTRSWPRGWPAPSEEPTSGTPEPRAVGRGPGRPRLGVVGREITLLPRHWAWLSSQPGGASVALRRLVERARRASVARDQVRRSQEAAYRFMSALAGNLPGFEEAIRALFAGDGPRFDAQVRAWPAGVRQYARTLAADALATGHDPGRAEPLTR